MSSRIVLGLLVMVSAFAPTRGLAHDDSTAEAAADSARAVAERQEELERRVAELEAAKSAHEEATRQIIRQALEKSGSQINSSVVFGGTFEYAAGWVENFDRSREGVLGLNTTELDFEIQVSSWALGSVVFQYNDTPDERIDIDTAFLTIGDTMRFAPFASVGRMVVPFGISTGNPVADVLTLDDPLTLEAFETLEDAIMLGLEFPTPSATRFTPRMAPPPVRPRVVAPFFGRMSRLFGYRPPPRRPQPQEMVLPTQSPPVFHAGVFFFNGDTRKAVRRQTGWHPWSHIGGTLGFRTGWIDADVDYTRSVFDSQFLQSEFSPFLREIGRVPGVAATVRANLGPIPFVAEWNGATRSTRFRDGHGRWVSVNPSAWQVSLGYQFDWNPWMESLGSEGTYLAFGYSETRHLSGITAVVDEERLRVGHLPERRFNATVGEWVLPGLRLAVGYSHETDYKKRQGGSGRSAEVVTTMLTYEW